MGEGLITIAEFTDINQAYSAQAHLAAEGIQTFFDNENNPFNIGVIGLKAKANEVAKALEILNKKEGIPEELTKKPVANFDESERCPKCGSNDTHLEKMAVLNSTWFYTVRQILNILSRICGRGGMMENIENKMYCFTCKHRWEKDKINAI